MPTISQMSALIADALGLQGNGRALASELARNCKLKPDSAASTQTGVALLIGHLLGIPPREAVRQVNEMLDYEIFGAFRFTVDPVCAKGESENINIASFPSIASDTLCGLVDAARLGVPAFSRPYSLELGTRYGIKFVHVCMQQIAPDADGRMLRIEVTYAPRGQTAVADYQVPWLGRWAIAACGGEILGKIAQALGPLTASGGGGIPITEEAQDVHDEAALTPIAAKQDDQQIIGRA